MLVVAVLVAADFFRRTSEGPHEYAEGQARDTGRETFPVSRAGSASSVSSFARPNWLVRTRLCLLAVVSAAAAALATGGVIHAAGAFQRASAQSQVSATRDGAVVSAILALVFAVAVLAAGLCSAMILIRSVVRPLHQLRAGAVEGRPAAVKAVSVSALDEIGDVARAFDQVQGEALRLAGQEAGLRGNLSEMFAELSGRGQSLAEHQLRLIDELGQAEQDAARRASLVMMNRLAARMRRHSQNLLVLAGQELPGRWDRPVPLVDVIRAAVAQTGEHERVSVTVEPDIAVSGPAVNDVARLVAELAENAASLSATGTPVDISGGTLATGGVLFEVTDQGVGMNPEMMAKANWRLEHPPPVHAAVSRHMGLFVVGRLAARHGIKVRLQAAATGGLTVLVWLPDPIVVPPGAGALVGFAPAEPKAQARHARAAGGPRATWRLRALAPGPEASPAEDSANGRRLPIYEAVRSADAARNRLAGFQRGASRGRSASSHDGRDPAL